MKAAWTSSHGLYTQQAPLTSAWVPEHSSHVAAGFTREGNRPKWTPLCRRQCTDAEGQYNMMGPPQHHIPLNSIYFYINFDSFKRADSVCSQEYTIHFVIGLTGNRVIPSTLKQHRFFSQIGSQVFAREERKGHQERNNLNRHKHYLFSEKLIRWQAERQWERAHLTSVLASRNLHFLFFRLKITQWKVT